MNVYLHLPDTPTIQETPSTKNRTQTYQIIRHIYSQKKIIQYPIDKKSHTNPFLHIQEHTTIIKLNKIHKDITKLNKLKKKSHTCNNTQKK